MLKIGVQTQNVIYDRNPLEGFQMLKRAGFSCCDFSLNSYFMNIPEYRFEKETFFDRPDQALEDFFTPHKLAAEETGIRIHQMHMPYPCHVPSGPKELNDYLLHVIAPGSMKICAFFDCPYLVVHGFKLAGILGSEEEEWKKTEEFLDSLAPAAKERGITICLENLYISKGGRILEGPCCNAQKAAERIDRINEKYGAEVTGFCLDTGHANLVGIDFENFISALGDRLKVLHIHDNDGIADLHQIPFTFTASRGNLVSTDWDGFIKGLHRIKYDRALSFETAPVLTAFPEAMKQTVLSFLAATGDFFRREIGRQS